MKQKPRHAIKLNYDLSTVKYYTYCETETEKNNKLTSKKCSNRD